MITYTHQIEIVLETCCDCGVAFGIEKNHRNNLLETGDKFYCPNGHAQHYSESTASKLEKLKKALKEEKTVSEWWKERSESNARETDKAKETLRVTRGQLTKTKNRIAAGVCPCCNRQFANLHRHMAGQHPEYTKEGTS